MVQTLAAKSLLLPALVLLPGVVAARRFGARTAVPVALLSLSVLGVSGVLVPFLPRGATEAALGATLVGLAIGGALAPRRWLELPARMAAVPGGELLAVAVFSVVVPFGALEWVARITTDLGWVHYHRPMLTWRRHGVEDWRSFHVTADSMREPDPVLFWRPKPGGPVSTQRFKSPLVELPKPESVFRIIAYGDSNTEGSRDGAWSDDLQRALDARSRSDLTFEVLNGGVAGYSSLQGLRRLRQESEVYEPDLILVSFGWNDVPEAVEVPDSRYRPPSRPAVALLHFLFHYRLYLVLENVVVSRRVAAGAKGSEPRVSIPEYLDNLREFETEARRVGARTVFLTRPHRLPEADQRRAPGWRARVPAYNEALRAFAAEGGYALLDVQAWSEAEGVRLFGDETHFNRTGRREMAQLLVDYLEGNGLLPE